MIFTLLSGVLAGQALTHGFPWIGTLLLLMTGFLLLLLYAIYFHARHEMGIELRPGGNPWLLLVSLTLGMGVVYCLATGVMLR